jgi:hypothetical protein
VAAGGKTGAYQMCLEARSPLVTAVLDPNFGKSSESKALPAKQEVARAKTTTSSTGSATKMDLLLSKTDSVGASRRPKTAVCIPTNQQQQQHLSHQQQPHDKRYSLAHFIESNRISSVLHSAWSSYERSIKNYGKDTNIDPVDEIQLRLSGFKWI